MAVGQLSHLDPDLHPRAGQTATLDFHGQQIRGQITAAAGGGLQIRPESTSLLRQLHPDSQLRAVVVARNGLCEVVLTRLSVRDGILSGQVVGHPVLVQRRAAPRVAVGVEAALVWIDPATGEPARLTGRTQNLSVGGALLRPTSQNSQNSPTSQTSLTSTVPDGDTVALLALRLPGPGGPVPLAVRVLPRTEGGIRLKIIELGTPAYVRFRSFVVAQL